MRTSAFGRALILTLFFASCIWLVADIVMACEYPPPKGIVCINCKTGVIRTFPGKRCRDGWDPLRRGVPQLSVSSMTVAAIVSDVPIAMEPVKGPRFFFEQEYSSRNDNDRTNHIWRTGYRWSHNYERRIVNTGGVYRLQDGSGDELVFSFNGTVLATR